MTRVNLYPNPSFRDGLANTAALNSATLSITSDYAFYGSDALLITKSASNSSGFRSTATIPVTAGLPYAISIYTRLPITLPATQAANLTLSLVWIDASSNTVSTSTTGVLTMDDDATWYRLSGVFVAPVGATSARVQVAQPMAGEAGQTFIVDAILFEQAAFVGGYLDNITQAEENQIVNTALTEAVPQVFNGMTLSADVIINGLVLNTIDEDGTLWVCTGISGWWAHSTPEAPDIPRGTDDGSYDVSGRYQARILTLTGSFIPKNSGQALSKSRDRLITATNLVRQGGWLLTNESPTKGAFVRLSGRPQIETVNARGRTNFSIGLKAADPVKYEWNDNDPEGYTHTVLTAAAGLGSLYNIGTAPVSAVFTITGPLGAGTSIYNALSEETMTIVSSLRGAGAVGEIIAAEVTNNIATMTTNANHHLLAGDDIIISGLGAPFDSIGTTYSVVASSQVFPYTFSFALTSDNIDPLGVFGQVALADNDVLVIDTYNKSVTFNGEAVGHRNKLETLTDWITLAPGNNLMEFIDTVDRVLIVSKRLSSNEAVLTSQDTHYLIVGENVQVALPEQALLARKSLTSNVVTLTTQTPHGFSVGDTMNVVSTEVSVVDQKSASGTEATLRTVDSNGISASDTIVVALPATATPVSKALASNVATITTQNSHGFSSGDSVQVALPASMTASSKQLAGNVATISSATAHGYQVGDSVTVQLSTTATVVTKSRVGAQAVLTTSPAHGFSINDTVVIALPTTVNLSATRNIASSSIGMVATLTTATAHGYSVGDKITVATGLTPTTTVTNRASATTTRTVTVGTHHYSVGETVVVSGMGASYNGTFVISAISGTGFSYVAATSLTESTTASSGSVTNTTISVAYNGSGKIIETVPTTTTFAYLVPSTESASSSTKAGTTGTAVNATNTEFNGTKTIVGATSTQLTYNL